MIDTDPEDIVIIVHGWPNLWPIVYLWLGFMAMAFLTGIGEAGQ